MYLQNIIAVVLTVEVHRDSFIYRQDYKHGIPQTELQKVGVTAQTGTRITIEPDPDYFSRGFDRAEVRAHIEKLAKAYPKLNLFLHDDAK